MKSKAAAVLALAMVVSLCVVGTAQAQTSPVKIMSVSPNPFSPNGDGHNDVTAFRVHIGNPMQWVSYSIQNANGQTIQGPHTPGWRAPGDYTFHWDGKNNSAKVASGGLYTIVVTTISGGASTVYGKSTASVRLAGPVVTPPKSTTDRVEYYVSGAASDGSPTSAFITMQTPTGDEQHDVVTPYTITQTFKPGDFLYISPQNDEDGYVMCEILVNGKTISSNEATGAYAIATCDGTAP